MTDSDETNFDDLDLSDFNLDEFNFDDLPPVSDDLSPAQDSSAQQESPFETEALETPSAPEAPRQEPYFEPQDPVAAEDSALPSDSQETFQDEAPQGDDSFVPDEAPQSDDSFVPEETENNAFENSEPIESDEKAYPPEPQENLISETQEMPEEFSDEQIPADAPIEEDLPQPSDEENPYEPTPSFQASPAPFENFPGIEESSTVGFLRWYSGTSTDTLYTVDKSFESGSFQADETCATLHINAGYDTYGWSVQFSNGVIMSLADVREYQLRNGHLPHSDGRIIYGTSALDFSNVARIVIYESVKYFSYGR